MRLCLEQQIWTPGREDGRRRDGEERQEVATGGEDAGGGGGDMWGRSREGWWPDAEACGGGAGTAALYVTETERGRLRREGMRGNKKDWEKWVSTFSLVFFIYFFFSFIFSFFFDLVLCSFYP